MLSLSWHGYSRGEQRLSGPRKTSLGSQPESIRHCVRGPALPSVRHLLPAVCKQQTCGDPVWGSRRSFAGLTGCHPSATPNPNNSRCVSQSSGTSPTEKWQILVWKLLTGCVFIPAIGRLRLGLRQLSGKADMPSCLPTIRVITQQHSPRYAVVLIGRLAAMPRHITVVCKIRLISTSN